VTQAEFDRLAALGYTRIALIAEARADLYTPLAVYMKLAGGPYSYLLESVVGGERFGRYSFIGLSCAERIEARGRRLRRLLRDARGADVCLEEHEADPFEYAREWLKRACTAPLPAALRFGGGLVGYFGYEAVRHIEPRALGKEKADPLGTPDVLLLVARVEEGGLRFGSSRVTPGQLQEWIGEASEGNPTPLMFVGAAVQGQGADWNGWLTAATRELDGLVTNLVPLPPLDGWRVLATFLSPRTLYDLRGIAQYGPIILLVLFLGEPVLHFFAWMNDYLVTPVLRVLVGA